MFQDFLFKYKKLVNKISLAQFFINESVTKKKKKNISRNERHIKMKIPITLRHRCFDQSYYAKLKIHHVV